MCKKILVTGAGGYIGQHVVKALLDKGADVIATDIRLDDVDDRATKVQKNIFEENENGGTDLSIIPRNISKIWTAITNSSAT